MNTLTKTEIKLLEEYIVKHNINTFDVPTFLQCLERIVPSWRMIQIAGRRVYEFVEPQSYTDYINQLKTSLI